MNEIAATWNHRNRYPLLLYSICFYINVKITAESLIFLRSNFRRLLKNLQVPVDGIFCILLYIQKSMTLKPWIINLWRIFFLCMRGTKKFYVNLVTTKSMDSTVSVIDCFKDVFKKKRRDNSLSIMR